MKKAGFIVLIATLLLCCLPAQAQLSGLINKGKQMANKAKEVKEKVEDEINGDVKFDDGRKVGEVLDGGVVNCHATINYLTLADNGDVMMDGEAVGHINDAGDVTLEGVSIGKAPGLDKQVAALIYFGILFDKQGIATVRAKVQEEQLRIEQERKQAEEARLKAAQEAEAKAKAAGTTQASGKKSNSNNTKQKVKEWTIEKNGQRGYVDANGVVYNWAHNKIGQLPKGSGDIKNDMGSTIGRISSGDIYKNGNKVCTVTSGGSISVPGSNATVAEVRAGGRIDRTKDSKTLGYCDARPYEWAVAIIFCDFFKF